MVKSVQTFFCEEGNSRVTVETFHVDRTSSGLYRWSCAILDNTKT